MRRINQRFQKHPTLVRIIIDAAQCKVNYVQREPAIFKVVESIEFQVSYRLSRPTARLADESAFGVNTPASTSKLK